MKAIKVLRNVIVWVLISLTIQCLGLVYVDKYILANSSSFKGEKVAVKKSPIEKERIIIKVPSDAMHLNLSYDAKYMAYYENDLLKIVNTKDATSRDVEFEKGIKVSYYKWLPDRNRMLIAEKQSGKSGSGLKLAFYDVEKDQKEDIKSLTWVDNKAEVTDITLSTFTNVIYVKVSNGGNRSSIYWLNIMKNSKKVNTKAYMIGNISVIPHEDKLVYEDLTYKKIDVTNVKNPLNIKGVTNPSLISVDGEDNIYIGSLDGDKITKIYSGLVKQPTDSWSVLQLKEPVSKKDMFVNNEGKVLINDNLKGTITDAVSGKSTTYSGMFMQIYDTGVASVSNGELVKTQFVN